MIFDFHQGSPTQTPTGGIKTRGQHHHHNHQNQQHCQKCSRPTRHHTPAFASTVTATSKSYHRNVTSNSKKESKENKREENGYIETKKDETKNHKSTSGLTLPKGSKIPSNATLRRILSILKETSV